MIRSNDIFSNSGRTIFTALWDFGCVSPCLLWGYQIRPSSSVAAVVWHYRHCLCPFSIYFTKSFWCYRLCFPSWEFISRQFRRKLFAQGRGLFWFSRRLPFRLHVFSGCISSDAPRRFLANTQKKKKHIYCRCIYIYIYIYIYHTPNIIFFRNSYFQHS